NAATGDYEDLVKAGVIDPAKVTRAALQNAASIAGLVLTTEALVADKPQPPAPAGAGGDPMGGMRGTMQPPGARAPRAAGPHTPTIACRARRRRVARPGAPRAGGV